MSEKHKLETNMADTINTLCLGFHSLKHAVFVTYKARENLEVTTGSMTGLHLVDTLQFFYTALMQFC